MASANVGSDDQHRVMNPKLSIRVSRNENTFMAYLLGHFGAHRIVAIGVSIH